ncbi:hypothetical protein SLEP1_g57698 [Rubroshorea leprosula]|uniref:Uncharacterized protein n=1 Tax=Rubroshorea leprosula TaxID=152421 RepID=A0AAV5MLY9_9ROSI|nr:hypothetical protein SLEP1_g57698 [Rubroshorea leprosula]
MWLHDADVVLSRSTLTIITVGIHHLRWILCSWPHLSGSKLTTDQWLWKMLDYKSCPSRGPGTFGLGRPDGALIEQELDKDVFSMEWK